jgi:hypothetical protein
LYDKNPKFTVVAIQVILKNNHNLLSPKKMSSRCVTSEDRFRNQQGRLYSHLKNYSHNCQLSLSQLPDSTVTELEMFTAKLQTDPAFVAICFQLPTEVWFTRSPLMKFAKAVNTKPGRVIYRKSAASFLDDLYLAFDTDVSNELVLTNFDTQQGPAKFRFQQVHVLRAAMVDVFRYLLTNFARNGFPLSAVFPLLIPLLVAEQFTNDSRDVNKLCVAFTTNRIRTTRLLAMVPEIGTKDVQFYAFTGTNFGKTIKYFINQFLFFSGNNIDHLGVITITNPNDKIPTDLPIDYTQHPDFYANLLNFSTDADTPIHRALVEYIAMNITVQKAGSIPESKVAEQVEPSSDITGIPPIIPEFTSQAESKEPDNDVFPPSLDDLASLPSLDFSRSSEVSEITMPVITVSDSSDESSNSSGSKYSGSDVVYLSAAASICSIDLRKEQLKKAIPTLDIQLAAMKFQIGDLTVADDTELRDALMLDLSDKQREFEAHVESVASKNMEVFDAVRYSDALHQRVCCSSGSTSLLPVDAFLPVNPFSTHEIVAVVTELREAFTLLHTSSRDELQPAARLQKLYYEFSSKPNSIKLANIEKALSNKYSSIGPSIVPQADEIRALAHAKLRHLQAGWELTTDRLYNEAMDVKAFVHASLAELE